MRLWLVFLAAFPLAAQWPQFRGPNGSGVAPAHNLPTEFGPGKNMVWKADIPAGHSSPVITGDRIFLTAAEGEKLVAQGDKVTDSGGGKLWTLCLDRRTGEILWKKQAPKPRSEGRQKTNSAASPSPATDGRNVYVFFGDYGLIAYDLNGGERWRQPLGPFINANGQGTSPIVEGNLVVLVCDQDKGSYAVAFDAETGRRRWKIDRPEVTRGYATPVVFHPESGPAELIVNGAYRLDAYNLETGERLWWVRGLSWHPKNTPVIAGNMIFAHSADSGGEAETPTETPTYQETLAEYDANKDGVLQLSELPVRLQSPGVVMDPDNDGIVTETEWNFYRARRSARNALVAVRHGGIGDLTSTNVVWSMRKFLPNVTSPLYYEGVLYLVKEGGILTSIDPGNGAILKQGRLTGALGQYWASPVAGDGKIYAISEDGKVTVIKAGPQWEILALNDLNDTVFATPAIVEDRIYVRTQSALYCFANRP
jgi:outer membrane protein assembly factor BamB